MNEKNESESSKKSSQPAPKKTAPATKAKSQDNPEKESPAPPPPPPPPPAPEVPKAPEVTEQKNIGAEPPVEKTGGQLGATAKEQAEMAGQNLEQAKEQAKEPEPLDHSEEQKLPDFVEPEENLTFKKEAEVSEKEYFQTVLATNRKSISSLRNQVIELQAQLDAKNEEIEKLKSSKDTTASE